MLLRFSIENHLSIRDPAEVTFIASSLKERTDSLISSRYSNHGVLPVLAIYGANASGKSNLLFGLARLRSIVQSSFLRSDDERGLPYSPFLLDSDHQNQPTKFELDFEMEDVRYQFGVHITKQLVKREWLYSFPKKTQTVLFYRDNNENSEETFTFGRSLSGSNRQIQSITKKNTLFLSAAKKAGHPLLSKISDYFHFQIRTHLSNSGTNSESIADRLKEKPDLLKRVTEYLSLTDTGVSDIKIDEIKIPEKEREGFKEVIQVLSKFMGSNELEEPPETRNSISLGHLSRDGVVRYLDFGDESLGTRYLLALLPPMIEALQQGGSLILDEITTSLHTLLANKLVSLFNDPSINKNGAQLVFTTHDTNLLAPGILRRDAILFAEKGRDGASIYFPLTEIKTKNTDNIERGYIQGRFGAIPYIDQYPT